MSDNKTRENLTNFYKHKPTLEGYHKHYAEMWDKIIKKLNYLQKGV